MIAYMKQKQNFLLHFKALRTGSALKKKVESGTIFLGWESVSSEWGIWKSTARFLNTLSAGRFRVLLSKYLLYIHRKKTE